MKRNRRYVLSIVFVVALAALSLAGLLVFNTRPKLGLDLQGGLSVVLTAKGKARPDVLDQTVEIIRNRVDSIGAQEPDISRSGNENIIVQLPGIRDPERALEIIGKTAQLRFREVVGNHSIAEAEQAALKEKLERGTKAFDRFVNRQLKKEGWTISSDDPKDKPVVYPSSENPDLLYRLGPAEVAGSDVADAFAQFDQSGGGWMVILDLTGDGKQAFADVTTRLAGTQRQLAIVLDRRVESAPAVQQAITDGRAQITGQFTEREAKDLALVLRTGALPIELERSQVQRVSATLGTASLRSGLIAGLIGLAAVAIYMFLFYRLLGVVTLLGMGIYAALLLGLIGVISATRGFSLTLAGVAGLIVSVGIAADSYIIYFERVKDELKEGKTFRSAVERAFRPALRTNLAANGVAFFAAIILYIVAVGPVRGFALMLGISLVFDIGLLYFYTHPVVALIARNRQAAGLRGVGMREAVGEVATA
ncbi:MAG TPA: protein translocase subunit SecD [Actinomycetota bacterium]|nr:protein translocase subunit SecD [Actinomycetota bacterium]